MQVTISVGGRFHAFELASQLQKRGFLRSLITSYPKFKVSEWGNDRNRIRSILSHEVLSRACRKITPYDLQVPLNFRYDRIAAKRLSSGTDIVVAFSGMALQTLTRARAMQAKTIVERSSSHIKRQDQILREEYELTGVRLERPHPRVIAQECEEYELADYICVPSLFAYESFVAQGVPPAKLLLAQFGVDALQFQAAPKQDSRFRVIHCGTLSIRKGVHYLLQAFHELKLSDADLWLVGRVSPEIVPYLQRYVGPNVILRGTFPQAELQLQYSQCSVFCLASIEEGFGMVMSQAMSCAVPVVCTENTGAADLVSDQVDGFVVPIRNVEALKERLGFLYAHRDRARSMGEAARKKVLDHFTWEHYGDRIVHQYSRLLRSEAGEPVGGRFG